MIALVIILIQCGIITYLVIDKVSFSTENRFNPYTHACMGRYLEWMAFDDMSGEKTYWDDGLEGMTYCELKYQSDDQFKNKYHCSRCQTGTWTPKYFLVSSLNSNQTGEKE